MIQGRLFRFINLSNTAQLLAENILGNGSARLRLPAASSKLYLTVVHLVMFEVTDDLTTDCRSLTNAQEQPSLRVYSTGDGPDVYEDKFMKIAKPDGTQFHPTLILVGTRLGIDKITPVYWDALIAALQMPQSVGIAG